VADGFNWGVAAPADPPQRIIAGTLDLTVRASLRLPDWVFEDQPMRANRSRSLLTFFLLVALADGAEWAQAAALANPRPPTPPITAGANDWFEDVTQRAGIDFVQQFCHRRIANILLSNRCCASPATPTRRRKPGTTESLTDNGALPDTAECPSSC